MRLKNKQPVQGRQPKYRQQPARDIAAKERKQQAPRQKSGTSNKSSQVRATNWLRGLPLFLAILVIVGSMVYIARLDVQSAKIRVVTVEDSSIDEQLLQDLRRDDSYLEVFRSELSSSLLNRSKFTIRSASVIGNILQAHPEIASAEIRYGVADDTPILHMVLREPHIVIVEEDRSLLLDRHGRAFAELPDKVVTSNNLAIIEDIAPMEISLGEQLLPIETVEFIDQLRHQLRSNDLDIATKTLPAIANELHVRLQGDDYIGKFDITGDARFQAGAFIATREQLIDDAVTPMEYIDARVIGRVYYR